MSSIFVTTRKISLQRHIERLMLPGSWTQSWTADLINVATCRLDNRDLWSPAATQKGDVQILLGGRIALEESDWTTALSLEYKGGAACKWILDLYLRDSEPFNLANVLNGAFLVIIVDHRHKKLHLWTDRMGAYAVYQVDKPEAGVTLGTHPDVLAKAYAELGEQLPIDWTTVAECLQCGSGVHPYTYYKGIAQLEPASYYGWDLESETLIQRHSYWQPEYEEGEVNYPDELMTQELTDALEKSVKRRSHALLGPVGIMLSGGADSRAALFAARIPSETTCFTFYDEPNEELETAERLAIIAQAQHVKLKRDSDYYAANSTESVTLSGGMWNLADAHFMGFQERVLSYGLGVVLTGCYADYMFKGLGFNRGYKNLLGKNLPLRYIEDFNFQFYHTYSQISAGWSSKVNARLAARFPDHLRREYPSSSLLVESLRLRPLSREADAAGRAALTRAFPWDPFLLDNDVVRVFGRMNARQKVNGVIFGRAVGRILPRAARKVPNNNYGTPVDSSEFGRAFWFVFYSLKRKLCNGSSGAEKLSTSGSWPNFSYYVSNSPAISDVWRSLAASENACFSNLLGFAPDSRSLKEWANYDAMQFLRLFNLLSWIRVNEIRCENID